MTKTGGVSLGFVVEVVEDDALQYKADVLAVKHAPRASGLGAQVRKRLKPPATGAPGVDEYQIFSARGIAQTDYVLIVGTVSVFELDYPQLRTLAHRFLEALWESKQEVKHLATTLHGVRTGAALDEVEAFRSLLLGLADAYAEGHYPPMLRRVTFVEKDPNRVRLMQDALRRFLPDIPAPAPAPASPPAPAPSTAVIRERQEPAPAAKEAERMRSAVEDEATIVLDDVLRMPADEAKPVLAEVDSTGTQAVLAGLDSFGPEFRKPEADESTPHIFVAMPFRDEYDDQYYLAIQPVIHELGLLSERMDLDAFTGDIKGRMLDRIRSARLLVALLDGGNPNVYLEVGYAWGVETPAILIAHQGETLPFDVRGERVLIYDKIYRLKQMLSAELARLLTHPLTGEES